MTEFEEIGGYFELELPLGNEYHNNALRFNTARNALSYFLLKNKITDLYIPVYICDKVVNTIKQGKTRIHFYHLDDNFSPLLSKDEIGDAYILLVNYFGICEKVINKCIKKFDNVICDNAQAFFSNPESDVVTFYSPRKFFGVADGGYIYANGLECENVVQDDSTQRYMSRLVRIDGGFQAGNFLYRNSEQLLNRAKIRRMSGLTQKILSSIHYDEAWEKRQENFHYLHKNLKKINLLKLNLRSVHGPMVYPLMIRQDGLRNFLIENKIYIPQYWPEVSFRTHQGSFEYQLANDMCPLPIDQRYSKKEMNIILELINKFLDKTQLPVSELPDEIEDKELVVNSSA
ncbi:MAG: hypothetical protein D8M58_01490 [Calditrichaeota bacterium]|nr:MAG: hypothetical protein DWQ03_05590 [Calditrichota bacterium]MBL1204042.1 hypothetical protein [Calditrichota bacterium]NOG43873.1 hypothetical protein [Calditrichota bacterium]